MKAEQKRGRLSPAALFFSLFFSAASGLYIYDVKSLLSLAVYILISIIISIVAMLGAGRQSGDLRLYFEAGGIKAGAALFCAAIAVLTASALLCDIFSLARRISRIYSGSGSAILLILPVLCVFSAIYGIGAVSRSAQISIVTAVSLALLALFSDTSPIIFYLKGDACDTLKALGGIGSVFCLVSHTCCGGDPDTSKAFGARSRIPESRARFLLAVSCGAFACAAIFHLLVSRARYSEIGGVFFLLAEWAFCFIRLCIYSFTLRDCISAQKSNATKTITTAAVWLSSVMTLAAISHSESREQTFLELSAVANVLFAASLAAIVLFNAKKSRRLVAKKR